MTTTIAPIANRMIDAFDTYATDCDPDDQFELRPSLLSHTLTIARIDSFDDCAILHCDINDEMHELTLIAIFDRDSLTIRKMLLNADTDTIDIPDHYFTN